MGRAVIVAGGVHVACVVAFLIAVGTGGATRLLLALGGAVGASLVWVLWLRSEDDTVLILPPARPRPAENHLARIS